MRYDSELFFIEPVCSCAVGAVNRPHWHVYYMVGAICAPYFTCRPDATPAAALACGLSSFIATSRFVFFLETDAGFCHGQTVFYFRYLLCDLCPETVSGNPELILSWKKNLFAVESPDAGVGCSWAHLGPGLPKDIFFFFPGRETEKKRER